MFLKIFFQLTSKCMIPALKCEIIHNIFFCSACKLILDLIEFYKLFYVYLWFHLFYLFTYSFLKKIPMEQRVEKVGLGYDKPVPAELDESVKKKQDIWKKVQVRYNKLDWSMEWFSRLWSMLVVDMASMKVLNYFVSSLKTDVGWSNV